MRGVHKRFGGVVALAGVDLSVAPGEVHALLGENGAGKSTLMKVLSGALEPDAGTLELDGHGYAPRGTLQARRRGVAMIYQELSLASDLSVAQNVMLGAEWQRAGFLRREAMGRHVRQLLGSLGHPEIDPDRRVAELGPGARQLIEVARALAHDAQIVVMDEPTSSLSADDSRRLFELTRRLAERGISVIYITHFLEEVRAVAGRFTVLRDGATVVTGAVAEHDNDSLIEAMVGRRLQEAYPSLPHEAGEVALELRALSGERLPQNASLGLRRGEILGIAGLVGAGRSELLRALFGLDAVRAGEIAIAGVRDRGKPPWVRLSQGVGLLSEKRKEEGLLLGRSIVENLTLSRLEPARRGLLLDRGRQRQLAERWIEALQVRAGDPWASVGTLSGGNQQKVALARLLHQDAELLLLDEPTRGVDVGSKAEIYRLILELSSQGKAILMVSSYLPELLGICDRIAVMHRGQLGEARPRAQWDEASLMAASSSGVAIPEIRAHG